ncbi:hypothetical protein H0G86_012424 [Trichoderma simmonsii]|uniref:Uncharacterized protein n=1 Tax=Trichoderma simmonsii TaxID=1491479 RepID=A0A8G0LSG5_9HYPO|nr:hypothetical protein H0G86_012424 [Trichoderma simmonsii]
MTDNFRSDLGPLTTTFTPPADCTSLQFIEDDAVGRNIAASHYCYEGWNQRSGYTTLSVIKSCFPDDLASYYNARWASTDHIGVYSPASVCPSGYTVACAHSRIKGQSNPFEGKGGVPADLTIWELLRDGETATGCCPTGYGCDQKHPAMCMSRPNYFFKVTDGIKCPGSLTPITRLTEAASAMAMKVMVVHAAPTAQTVTRTTTSSASASLVSSENSLSKPSQDLPPRAKTAIGVIIPLVAIFIGAACFFIHKYRRKRKLSQAVHELGQDTRGNGGDDLETTKPELPGDAGMASAGPNGAAFRKAELDATGHGSGGAVELAAELAGGGIAELHSTPSPRELDSTPKGLSVVDVVEHDVDNQHVDERSRGLWQWSNYQD